jgi:hypothetical protein
MNVHTVVWGMRMQDAPVTDKLAIEEHLVLSATAPWVDTPDLLLLHHNGRRYVQRSVSLRPKQPICALCDMLSTFKLPWIT